MRWFTREIKNKAKNHVERSDNFIGRMAKFATEMAFMFFNIGLRCFFSHFFTVVFAPFFFLFCFIFEKRKKKVN